MSDDTSFAAVPPTDDEWVTVSEERPEETKLDFRATGDAFTGTFIGTRTINGENRNYTQYRFEAGGEVYFAAGASLDDGMRKVRPNSRVRITYIADQDTGQRSPMKIYRVEVARTTR